MRVLAIAPIIKGLEKHILRHCWRNANFLNLYGEQFYDTKQEPQKLIHLTSNNFVKSKCLKLHKIFARRLEFMARSLIRKKKLEIKR